MLWRCAKSLRNAWLLPKQTLRHNAKKRVGKGHLQPRKQFQRKWPQGFDKEGGEEFKGYERHESHESHEEEQSSGGIQVSLMGLLI